jgi:non-specific serine/threonine protein kinase
LLGAAAALREITGAPVPTAERTQFDLIVRRIHQQLADDAVEAEQATGRALSAEQAIEYALQRERARRPASGVLTRRESEVATLVAQGMTNRQIAETMLLTRRTVSTHLEHIFAKLSVQTRAEVAVWITHHADGHSAE